ncbi:hypothetical protein FF1_035871 [Malus domestica]
MHRCFVGLALCHLQRLPRKKRERKSEHGRDPGHEGPERMAADALFNTLPAAFVHSLLGFLLISTMDADESDDLSREEEASDTKSMEEGEMAQQQKPRLSPEIRQIPHELPHR